MGRCGDLDYPKLTKRGFLLGLTVLLAGAAGEAFLSPIVFGFALSLTE